MARSAQAHREGVSGKAPRLDLQDVDGNPVSFDDLSGQKRVLVTWASWCGCRHELAGWQRLQDELADEGLRQAATWPGEDDVADDLATVYRRLAALD